MGRDAPAARYNARGGALGSGGLLLAYNVDCHIKDLSESGYRIRLLNPMLLPRSFEQQMQGEEAVHQCEVWWRSTNELGLMFVKSA